MMDDNFEATSTDNVATKENQDVLTEIRDLSKKRLLLQRISTGCMVGTLLVVLVAALLMVPRATTTLNHINQVAVKAEDSLAKVDKMTASMESASDNLNELVNANGEALSSAVKSMSEVDFDGLNKAISDLQEAIGPLANFMSRFGR
ncbi:hypothetical protein [Butyrivibrio sp. MC2021]|uniref:hypothetical protein n=1 Tax=Butyrivibrio sp. MC2021 TaxID=1408306 RepID=UPI000478B31A|nr:hypothetical protein [Butyrivibrio sp. MC2021]